MPRLPLLVVAVSLVFTACLIPLPKDHLPLVPVPSEDSNKKATLSGSIQVASSATSSMAATADAQSMGEAAVTRDELVHPAREALRSHKAFRRRHEPAPPPPIAPEVVPGELVISFTDEALSAEEALVHLRVEGIQCVHGGFASPTLHLIRCRGPQGALLEAGQLRELIPELSTRPGVRFVELNGVVTASAVPTDPYYAYQWHYALMNLEAAWDITQGTPSVVVAVLDTGSRPHPDLDANLVAGIDLISDPARAGDGNGRDDDPTDTGGDLPNGSSSWHGLHVAGTIGALAGNGQGGVGVAWKSRVQHVRVLGHGGGTDFDVAAGIRWAAGLSVPGSRQNSTPARVLNLSLGATGSPSQLYQEAINAAVSKGAVVVVAAGNEDANAANTSPCNQQNVICVGATGYDGTITGYSNYGSPLDVMAPGGDLTRDRNQDGYYDGVLSTYAKANGSPDYNFMQGTSMATPHVAGLAALMLGVNPSLTASQVEHLLKATANPAYSCNIGCGAGLVDAHAAVMAAKGQSHSGPAKLVVGNTALQLRASEPTSLSIANTGGQSLALQATVSGSLAGRLAWAEGTTLQLAPGKSGALVLSVNTEGLSSTIHGGTLHLTSNGGNADIPLTLNLQSGGQQKPVLVVAVHQDDNGEWQVGGAVFADASAGQRYSLTLPAGTYYLLATTDLDGDEEYFEEDEPLGIYRSIEAPVEVKAEAGGRMEQLDFVLLPRQSLEGGGGSPPAAEVGGACTGANQCPAGGGCIGSWPGGYCTQECPSNQCPSGSACVGFDTGPLCMDSCGGVWQGQADCRPGYVCTGLTDGRAVCLPDCNEVGCAAGRSCRSDGYCV
jgi:serine protease